jgi:serine/threonine-protein kinase
MQAERRGLVGTPAYMAPEQARGELCGPKVDIYGVAALALELLTGRPPYDYDSPQEALTAILSEPPASPSSRGVNAVGLDAVFAKGLHTDPDQRFQCATEFVEALERVFQEEAMRQTAAVQAVVIDGAHVGTKRAASREARATTMQTRGWQRRRWIAKSAARSLFACACAAVVDFMS